MDTPDVPIPALLLRQQSGGRGAEGRGMGSLRANRSSFDAARFATAKTVRGPALSNQPRNKPSDHCQRNKPNHSPRLGGVGVPASFVMAMMAFCDSPSISWPKPLDGWLPLRPHSPPSGSGNRISPASGGKLHDCKNMLTHVGILCFPGLIKRHCRR